MSSLHLAVAHQFLKTVLQNVTTQPVLVNEETLFLPNGVTQFMQSLKPRHEYSRDLASTLQALSDHYPNLSSADDYSFKDVLGSFPSDDPHRAGWWLISCGTHFQYIIATASAEQESEAEYVERTENHINDEDIYNLVKLFHITTRCQGELKVEDLNYLVEQIRKYDGTQRLLTDLLAEDTRCVLALDYTALESIHYQPGAVIYSLFGLEHDQILLQDLAISVRYPNSERNIIFTFDQGELIQYPSQYLDTSVHDSIMRH